MVDPTWKAQSPIIDSEFPPFSFLFGLSLDSLTLMFSSWLPQIFISFWTWGKDILWHIWCEDLVVLGFCWMIFEALTQILVRSQAGVMCLAPQGFTTHSCCTFGPGHGLLMDSGLANTPKISMGVASSIPAKWLRNPRMVELMVVPGFKRNFHFDLRLESCFNQWRFLTFPGW